MDRAVTWLIATFVDGRAFPMFGLLFGYGVAQIVRRQTGTAWATRFLLWRRSLVLVVLGFLHAMLLYVGDILGAYGVLLFLGVWAIRWKDRWLLIVAALFFALTALPSADSLATSTDAPDQAMLPPDLWTQFAERITGHPFIALLGPIGFLCPFLVGRWAGRRRILENPAQHRRWLTTAVVVGIGAAVLGAQPVSLVLARVIDKPSDGALSVFGPLHDAAGVRQAARWIGEVLGGDWGGFLRQGGQRTHPGCFDHTGVETAPGAARVDGTGRTTISLAASQVP